MGSDGGWDKSMRTEALIDDDMECELDRSSNMMWKVIEIFYVGFEDFKKNYGKI